MTRIMGSNDIKILITGDFCPINRIEKMALNQEFGAIFNDIADVLGDNDLNIIDLECPLTELDSARPKTGPHQKAHPHCIKILTHAGINLATMANNHIMDYDNKGVIGTLELCKDNNIDIVGIGKTLEEAGKPYSINIKGKRIAILNYADNEFLSTPDGSFNCNPLNYVQCFYDIRDLKRSYDHIVVILHAGNEFYNLPSPRTKKLSRYLIDLGADVVLSHHTHAFTGYEIYRARPIFYGLGNFIYDWPGKIDSEWNKGYIVKLRISNKVDFDIIPIKQCNEKAGVFHLNTKERDAFNLEIGHLNQIIADDKLLEDEFQKYCKSVFFMYDAFIEPYFGKYITALRRRGFFPKLLSPRKRLLLLNIIRCESHREVLLRLLKQSE